MVHKQLNLPEFQILFDQIMGKVKDIRGYYYDNLDIHDDTLSWIVIIGGLFLQQLICKEAEGTADLMEFVDSLGGRFSMDAILKDVVMIENQIPFFVLEHLVARSHPASEISKSLFSMSMKFCTRISPIVLKGVFFKKEIEYPFHLLDLLYSLVWHGGWDMDMAGGAETRSGDIWCDLWGLIKTLNVGALNIPVKIIDLVLKILEKLGISVSFPAEEEKVLIPTASQLSSVNVKFCSSTTLGIKFIFFNKNNATLSLPILKLKINISEVIIRNLLAYEPIANPEIQNSARYIELMGAMIHTVEDVNLLKEKKILRHDGDEEEVVELFKGIKSSIPSDGRSDFDEAIKILNEHYNNNWKIKLKKLMMKYAYSSWKILTVVATILVLLLMSLQTFCSIYNCHGIFKTRLGSLSWSLASST